MSGPAARAWWRVALVADLVLVTLAWVGLIGFMHAPFWTPEPQHHDWSEYLRASAAVLVPGLAIVAAAAGAGRWLVARGWHRAGVLAAALPVEAAFVFIASRWQL